MIKFCIPGRIGGKGRIRVNHATGQHFMDAKTRSTEAVIRHYAAEAMRGRTVMTGPVSLHVMVVLNPPPSWSIRKRAEAHYVTGRPDADNIVKAISDACNKIVFADDAQVSVLSLQRLYDLSKAEHTVVSVHDLTERPFVSAAARPHDLGLSITRSAS